MSVVYSLVAEEAVAGVETTKVRMTSTIPEKVEVKDLGEKTVAVAKLTAEIAQYQTTIEAVTAQQVEAQAKLDAINALK